MRPQLRSCRRRRPLARQKVSVHDMTHPGELAPVRARPGESCRERSPFVSLVGGVGGRNGAAASRRALGGASTRAGPEPVDVGGVKHLGRVVAVVRRARHWLLRLPGAALVGLA
ncbi:hypothetical protein CF640_36450 [Burkholderia pseudomallei]|nr:hypothetical protein CF640_36450 [Burkholderia pseudomallei]